MSNLQLPDDNQVKQVVLHYKKFYVSIGIILACIMLFFWFIIPEIQLYTDQQTQTAEIEGRIEILRKNIGLLTTISDADQTEQLQKSLEVLPEDKDYSGILYAIRTASAKSGIGIGDFAFNVGELSGKNIITKSTPFISMKLNLIGDPIMVERFIEELAKTPPLSNVSEIRMSNQTTNLVLTFYYKPIPQLRVNYSQPLLPLGGVNLATLKTVQDWKGFTPTLDALTSVPVSSQAAGFE